MKDTIFEHYITKCLDNMYINFDEIMCIGDLNYYMLKKEKPNVSVILVIILIKQI
jgi:hypothetical protein